MSDLSLDAAHFLNQPANRIESNVGTPTASQTDSAVVRVLHVINGEHFSGAERVQDLLGKCLPSFGYDVTFACIKPGKFATARTASSSDIVDSPMRNRFDLSPAWHLSKLVKEEDFQLIHAHTPRSALIGMTASALSGTPFVYHVHSPTARDSTRRFQNWLNQRLENLSIAKAKQLICVSNSLKVFMQSLGVAENRLAVVHNGVPSCDDIAERSTPTEHWTLGTVALFRPRKGLEILLQAMAKLRDRGQIVKLRAVGPFETPDYETSIHGLVDELKLRNQVEWIGFTQDVNYQLNQMDLFVLPSLFGEGLPMVVLEAMAVGTPVVATDVEGVTEAIIHGESGVVAAPQDAEDLASKIADVVSGKYDWQNLRSNAVVRHQAQFSDVAMARGVASAYDEILLR